MKLHRTACACALAMSALAPASLWAQMPNLGSMIPDKAALLEQAKKLVAELVAMKQNPKLSAAEKGKVDSLLPQATQLNSELAKPQPPSRFAELAGQLSDLQKQVGALKTGLN